MLLSTWKLRYFHDFKVHIYGFVKVLTKDSYSSTTTQFIRSKLQTCKLLSRMQVHRLGAKVKEKKAKILLIAL